MELILKEDVPNVGKAGEVIKVSEGHGRNYLLPRKKALLATPANLKQLALQEKFIEARRAKSRQEAQALGEKISALSIVIEKQAGEEDKIFGSVSTREIAKAVESQGILLDKRVIRIKEALRKLGEHEVEVHLHGDVVVPLKVVIQKQ